MGIAIGTLIVYSLGFIAVVIIVIYLIAKRLDAKKRETFEKRDN